MDLQGWLAERLAPFESALRASLPTPEEAPQALCAAMAHLLFPGGKRFRPALAMAGAEAVGAPAAAAHPMAVAVELVHTYSLIHDDLPCMDDDDLRRGRPTVHVAHGEANAVLAGDALLTRAFDVLAHADGDASAHLAALRELARASGARGLVGGQVDDLTPAERDLAAVESVHRRKSAALIAAAIAGGARLGGATSDTVDALRAFGLQVGVAFQIADDLLDAGEDDACSVLPLLGEQGARERADALLGEALASLPDLGEAANPLRLLARYAVRRRE
ncbi:MAG: polyprenyl synthetase family protein [Myxococcota bacterium]